MELNTKTICFFVFAIWLHSVLNQRFSDKEFQNDIKSWIKNRVGENVSHTFVNLIDPRLHH